MGEEIGLKDAERAFQGWRRSKRTSGGREIPEELWARAASVARVHGVTKTAERLRLNGTRLKQRCELEAGRGFVELAASELPLVGEFVVELENAEGVRLRLLLRGAPVEVVVTAAKELWSASR